LKTKHIQKKKKTTNQKTKNNELKRIIHIKYGEFDPGSG
jgi:hypothetical protein